MPRVVPSQVRELIEHLYPPSTLVSGIGSQLFTEHSSNLAAILAMAEKIPDELLALTGHDYNKYIMALETIRHQLSRWLHRTDPQALPQVQGRNTVLIIYEALKLCPDESPTPVTAALKFIGDLPLRDSICLDISAANRDLVSHEYKGATVLAGSATEALLLWAIQEAGRHKPGTIPTAVAALLKARTLPKKPSTNPEQWSFIELIEVAHQLKRISDDTATQARLAKDLGTLSTRPRQTTRPDLRSCHRIFWASGSRSCGP